MCFRYWRLCRRDFATIMTERTLSPWLDNSLFATAWQRLRLVLLTRRGKPVFRAQLGEQIYDPRNLVRLIGRIDIPQCSDLVPPVLLVFGQSNERPAE